MQNYYTRTSKFKYFSSLCEPCTNYLSGKKSFDPNQNAPSKQSELGLHCLCIFFQIGSIQNFRAYTIQVKLTTAVMLSFVLLIRKLDLNKYEAV